MKYLVLGIGNIMFADEGLGVHLCKFMQANYEFASTSHDVDFIDGGTLALRLSYIIAEYDKMVVLDCLAAANAAVGDVFFFPYDKMPQKISWSGSAHEVEMLQTLQYIELLGDLPQTRILGFVPKRIKPMSFVLSHEALKAAQTMENTLLEYLSSEGFSHRKIADISLQEIAENAYKS